MYAWIKYDFVDYSQTIHNQIEAYYTDTLVISVTNKCFVHILFCDRDNTTKTLHIIQINVRSKWLRS